MKTTKQILEKQSLSHCEVKWICKFEDDQSYKYKHYYTPLSYIQSFFQNFRTIERCHLYPQSKYQMEINSILKKKCKNIEMEIPVSNLKLAESLLFLNNNWKLPEEKSSEFEIDDYVEPYISDDSDTEVLDFNDIEEDLEKIFTYEKKGFYTKKHSNSLKRLSSIKVDSLRNQRAAEEYSQDILFLKKESYNFPALMEEDLVKKDVYLIHFIEEHEIKISNVLYGSFFMQETVCEFKILRDIFNLTFFIQLSYFSDIVCNMYIASISPNALLDSLPDIYVCAKNKQLLLPEKNKKNIRLCAFKC